MSALRCSSAGFCRQTTVGSTAAGDYVACFSCECIVQHWTAEMHPMALHRDKCHRHCRFVTEPNSSGNVPMGQRINLQMSEQPTEDFNSSASIADSLLSTAEKPRADGYLSRRAIVPPCTPLAAPVLGAHSDADLAIATSSSHFVEELKVTYRQTDDFSSSVDFSRGNEHPKYESYRLRTFANVWTYDRIVDARDLARNGFLYAGPGDRVQCAFCQGFLRNWEQGDRVDERHALHFTDCHFVQGHDIGNVPITSWPLVAKQATDVNAAEVTDAKRAHVVTSTEPRNPEFAIENRRLLTFATWPTSNFRKPEELAKAGFFYYGQPDAVQCFFCDGIVADWQAECDPYVVHAQRFPSCSFLLNVKGRDFVWSVRHEPPSNTSDTSAEHYWCIRTYQARDDQAPVALRVSPEMDPEEAVSARVDSKPVRIVLQMDYPLDLIREVIRKRLATVGSDHETSEQLLEDVFRTQDEKKQASSSRNAEENRRLKAQLRCKVCVDSLVGIVFLPCGHLVCCASCAPAMNTCPVCRVSIRGAVRCIQ